MMIEDVFAFQFFFLVKYVNNIYQRRLIHYNVLRNWRKLTEKQISLYQKLATPAKAKENPLKMSYLDVVFLLLL